MNKYLTYAGRFKLVVGLIGAILIALLLTFISVQMYTNSGTASLDLSRPGYEQAREQVRSDEQSKNFSPAGPVNKESLEEFKKLYQQELVKLNNSSSFNDQSLDDAQLRFTPETQSLPAADE